MGISVYTLLGGARVGPNVESSVGMEVGRERSGLDMVWIWFGWGWLDGSLCWLDGWVNVCRLGVWVFQWVVCLVGE